MSPFYAFITLDTPGSANRVRSPLSASSRNIERHRRSKTRPALRVRDFAFYHLVTQTSRWITWLKDNTMLPEVKRVFFVVFLHNTQFTSNVTLRYIKAPALHFSHNL